MRQGSHSKRGRGRGGNRRSSGPPSRNHTFDSNGPDIRIRGNAHQVHEKYMNLAREASTNGEVVLAESYFQHAEHYARILIENGKFDTNSSNSSKKEGAHKGEHWKKKDNQPNESTEKVSNDNGLDSIETEKISKSEDLESTKDEIAQN